MRRIFTRKLKGRFITTVAVIEIVLILQQATEAVSPLLLT